MSKAKELIDEYLGETRPLGTRQAVAIDKLAESFGGTRVEDRRVPITALAYKFKAPQSSKRFFNGILGMGYSAEEHKNEQTVIVYDVNADI